MLGFAPDTETTGFDMARLARTALQTMLAIAMALSTVVWVPASVPAADTVSVTLDFGYRTEVDVTAVFEAQEADGSWTATATATGKPKVTVTLPVGATVRVRVEDPTGFYAPGWLGRHPGTNSLVVMPDEGAAYPLRLVSGGTVSVKLSGAGVIRGRLVDETGAPLDGVKVTAWRQSAFSTSFTGTSDASGVVEITGVLPSSYRLRASDPQRRIAAEPFIEGSLPYFSGDSLTVPKAPDVASFDATLPAGAQVSGVVRRDLDGAPVAGAVVECVQYYTDPQLGPMQKVASVKTADDGSYLITGLTSSTNELRVGVGWTGVELPLTTPSFSVAAGEALSKDVTMTVGAWVTGSTTIWPTTSWSEEPYSPGATYGASSYLQADLLDGGTGEFVPQFPANTYSSGVRVNGPFRVRIPAGQYRFTINGSNVLPQVFPGPTATATIEAAPEATVDLSAITVARHTIIRGAAQKEAQEYWLNSGTRFTLWHKLPDGSFEAVASQLSLDSAGRFRFAGDLSGTYKITGVSPTAGYRTWAWPDGTDLESGQEFEIGRSEYRDLSTHTIQMIAGTLRATVKGLVVDADGEPVTTPLEGATVIVYKSIGWGPQEVVRLTTAADGSVSTTLPQGAYMLRVIEPSGAYSAQEFGFDDDAVYVYADEVTDVGDLELPKKGRMGGWVVSSATGGPIAGAVVTPSDWTLGDQAPALSDSNGYFETADMDWGLWNLSVTDPQERFAPLWFGQMFYPGIGGTEYWEIGMTPNDPQIERAAGANRYAACASAVAQSYAYADEVIIATGDAFPDALAGAPLSAALDAPLLLVQPGSIPPEIAAEIQRLGPTGATVLGGERSVSNAVVDKLVALGIPRDNIRRISGKDRFETAAKVALEVYALNGWTAEDDVSAYVASGLSFPDALSASSVSAMEGAPLLLVSAGDVPSSTAAALKQIAPDSVTVVGGRSVVGDGVVKKLGNARRVAGATRYATNAALVTDAIGRAEANNLYYDGIVLASGRTFPDALVGASVCSRRNALLVLVDGTLPEVSRPVVQRLGDGALSLITMGGYNSVSPSTEDTVRSYIR